MLFADLSFFDFLIIAAIVMFFAGSSRVAWSMFKPVDRERMTRIEEKLNLVMDHLKLDYTPPHYERWKQVANSPERKIEAIKLYREITGASLADAKQVVEDYMAGRDVDRIP